MSENIIIQKSEVPPQNRILIATATLGVVRMEWAQARFGQTIPCNWSSTGVTLGVNSLMPLGYLVADAQNIAVNKAVTENFEWCFLHEDDVLLPPDCFLKLNKYMKSKEYPVVSGLYYIKAVPSEPLVYRGRGNGAFTKWELGDLVEVDGVPTGCVLIHCSLLKLMWEESEEYTTGMNTRVRKVFETPTKVWFDPETSQFASQTGTSDLYWCDRVIKDKVLERTGWKKLANKKYPFVIDTSIFCRHIDISSGIQHPTDLIVKVKK